jgi:hypothetical protein
MEVDIVCGLLCCQDRLLLGKRSARRRAYPGVWDVPDEHEALAWFTLEDTTRLRLAHAEYPRLFAEVLELGQ